MPLLPSPITLPARIGPMRYTGAPHKYDDPRLGVSYQYGGDGLSLTVYIYDSGETNLVDGADTMPTCREFEIAKEGVLQTYQKPQLKVEQLVRLNPPDDLPQMREAQYEFEREGKPTISFIWITTAAKHFVKLRLSMNPRLREELPEARRAVLGVIGEAIKPHLVPPDPKSENAGSSLGFNLGGLGGGSDDALEAGVWYLMLLNTVADKSPELAPVCGGEFVPSLDTELESIAACSSPARSWPNPGWARPSLRSIRPGSWRSTSGWTGIERRGAWCHPRACRFLSTPRGGRKTSNDSSLRTSARSPLIILGPCLWSRFRRSQNTSGPL